LAETLRADIVEGRVRAGALMPGERELSAQHLVARMTARRALKTLEGQGLVRTESGKGYRVLSRGNDPTQGCPIAFVMAEQADGQYWAGFGLPLLKSLQHAAEQRGWSLLGVGAAGQSAARVIEQCISGRAWGLVTSTYDPEVICLAARAELPVVMIDTWEPNVEVDVVFQNGFLGGAQAAGYLVEHGHRRIAWYGQINEGVHSATRLGGALTTLGRHGLELSADCRIDALRPGAETELERLLARPDRPTAVLTLWGPHFREAVAVARKLGLAIGRDVELLGWTTVEQYDQTIASHFRGERVPPAVEWSIADMAEMAIDRLASRRENPSQPAVTINIQTKLRLPVAASVSGT